MLNIRRFIDPPAFKDEEQSRLAGLLNKILLLSLSGAWIYILSAVLGGSGTDSLLVFAVIFAIMILVSKWLLHHSRIRLAGALFALVIWTGYTLVSLLGAGVTAPGFGGYINIILITGIFWSWRAAFVLAALSLIFAAGIGFAQTTGLIVQQIDQMLSLVYTVLEFFIGASLLYLLINSYAENQDQLEDEVRARTAALRDANETLSRKIAERHEMGEALRESEARYRAIIEDQTELVCRFTSDGTLTFVNQAYCRYFGKDCQNLVGHSFMPVIPEPEAAQIAEEIAALSPEKRRVTVEHRVIMPDGETRWHQWTNHAIFDDEGALVEYQSVGRDISERKRAELALLERERDLYALLNATIDAAFLMEPDGKIVIANDVIARRFGYTPESFIGVNVLDILDPSVAERRRGSIAQLAIKGEAVRFQDEREGRLYDNSIYPIADDNGRVKRIAIYAQDITERKQAELALRESEERYRVLSELTSDFAYAIRVGPGGDMRFEWITDAFTRITGYTLSDLQKPLDLVHPEDVSISQRRIERMLSGEEDVSETRIYTKGGDLRWLREYGRPVKDNAQGRVVRIYGAATDITERKQAELALRESEERYRMMTENATDMISRHDARGNYLYVSPVCERLLGYAPEDLLGKNAYNFFHPDDLVAIQKSHSMIMAESIIYTVAYRIRCADDSYTWFETTSRTIHDTGTGELREIICVSRDISERKRVEQELERSNEELQQFAYVASHDLQEPLRVIASYLQLLQRRYGEKLGEDADKFINRSVAATVRMKELINGLLTYSRVSTRASNLELADLSEILESVLDNVEIAIEESGAAITHDALPAVPVDVRQIGQLFQNLITNALKFRREGVPPIIHIGAEKRQASWLLSVRDNGIGIESEYLDRIFAVFQRLHTRAEYPGTGIGLAVCKKIVERHGGQIWAESAFGEGTTFYFTFPIKTEERTHDDHQYGQRQTG